MASREVEGWSVSLQAIDSTDGQVTMNIQLAIKHDISPADRQVLMAVSLADLFVAFADKIKDQRDIEAARAAIKNAQADHRPATGASRQVRRKAGRDLAKKSR